MTFTLRPLVAADREPLVRLLAQPDLREAFDIFQGEAGLAGLVDDPHNHPGGVLVAEEGGALIGFGVAHLLPGEPTGWGIARIGVHAPFRRRGVARALFERLERHAHEHRERLRLATFGTSAWLPDPAAEGFADALRLVGERWFWLLERPRGPVPEPAWPAGVRVTGYDDSGPAREGFRLAYNDSFAHHYRWVKTTPEDMERLVAAPGFRADGVRLAWRGDRVVGFARNVFHGTRPELAILGTTHDARGLGLGRALLRWSVEWMQAQGEGCPSLLVDGENESALRLYTSEGFAIARRRRVWVRPLNG